ncbi:sugar phosphate nucleotidyltransferase [Dactylosporangium sp. CA-152071]|uniref:sugar phosphate nucleotidyltransferase n=1 Tax=Dactylosporangium sp. CA-152071 TaxID=3239933 RepID=UPI003D8A114A
MTTPITQVVVCAGGLGTRVGPWARHVPKEFQPVAGRPGILHLLDELTALAPARVVVVHHPFYTPFIAWAATTLTRGGQAAYQHAARLPRTDLPLHEQLDLHFTPQRGHYADITSVLNGAEHLRPTSDLHVAFADNLYPHDNPSLALATVPAGRTAVLVRPYQRGQAGHRGVITARHVEGELVLNSLVEKPTPQRALEMEDAYGPANLWLLEGRARLSRRFLDWLRRTPVNPGGEPKLSMALRRYATTTPVRLVITHSAVTDLGSPPAEHPSSTAALHRSATPSPT